MSSRAILLIAGAIIWLALFSRFPQPLNLLSEYGHFSLIGLLGAIVANSTGSGGGVIFIPFFTNLGLSSAESLGTSILIQCFGMTAGSISWLLSMSKPEHGSTTREPFVRQLLILCGIPTIAGILVGQYGIPEPPLPMVTVFRIFSVIFGLALLTIATGHHKRWHTRSRLAHIDRLPLGIICFTGGMVTAWISVGVGEWVTLYLIFRRYPTMAAVCIGVCMSSVATLTASVFLVWVVKTPIWNVILFAAPAAILGGSFAKYLAFRLGAGRLKIFFGTWILVTGFVM